MQCCFCLQYLYIVYNMYIKFILFCIIHEVFPLAETDLKAEIQTLRNRDEELKQRIQEVRFVIQAIYLIHCNLFRLN